MLFAESRILAHKLKILLVEDNPFQLQATVCLLETYGFTQITTADSADSALQKMQAAIQPFEILLCDQCLPDLPGLELIGIAHYQGYIRHAILLSSLTTDELGALKASAHAQYLPLLGYLAKPLKHSELLRLLTPLQNDNPNQPISP